MEFLYGLVILVITAILSTFCLGILAPTVVFSLSTVAASFVINLIILFLAACGVASAFKSAK
jgi:hypothetical protein